jgi:hypothetical protein
MQETNFCRQVLKEFAPAANVPDSIGMENQEDLSPFWNVIDLIQKSVKFMLPNTGRLLNDKQFKALDENEELHLPFPYIALEYFADRSGEAEAIATGTLSTKRIVLAREEDTFIVITPVIWFDRGKYWIPMPEVAIPKIKFLDRSKVHDGWVAINAVFSDIRIPMSDYQDEIGALLSFLNSLQCSNVAIERFTQRKTPKASKAALPFDSYRVLTISAQRNNAFTHGGGGAVRSPREHLRRGHIRRLDDGKKIWVNAAIVNAGKGGKVYKDYKVS